jgi:Zn-finger nucleic acid-binding protein
MRCPRDQAPLERQTYKNEIQVDRCTSCRGIWLDRGELELIQETSQRSDASALRGIQVIASAYELARQKARPDIACPKCERTLAPREYAHCSQILIDLCPGCGGVWLDRGELEALEQFFTRERKEPENLRKGFWASLTKLYPLYQVGSIRARFVRKKDQSPISGVSGRYSVKLFDRDLLRDDRLGEPRLDADGRVQFTFDLHDAVSSDSPLERRPDLYLVLYEAGKEIFRTPVFANAEFDRGEVMGGSAPVTRDLGTFEV